MLSFCNKYWREGNLRSTDRVDFDVGDNGSVWCAKVRHHDTRIGHPRKDRWMILAKSIYTSTLPVLAPDIQYLRGMRLINIHDRSTIPAIPRYKFVALRNPAIRELVHEIRFSVTAITAGHGWISSQCLQCSVGAVFWERMGDV